ncbi:MAG TPA: hypothetical protein PLF42_10905, partial [Anaerolineales bacterium]|nr:hypothetical protein [Anaerolineales bacterium]
TRIPRLPPNFLHNFRYTTKEKIAEAKQAVENGFLFVGDGFSLNIDDPAIVKAREAIRELEECLKLIDDDEDNNLYEILLSEYEFEPYLTNKRYWEKLLYGKSLY